MSGCHNRNPLPPPPPRRTQPNATHHSSLAQRGYVPVRCRSTHCGKCESFHPIFGVAKRARHGARRSFRHAARITCREIRLTSARAFRQQFIRFFGAIKCHRWYEYTYMRYFRRRPQIWESAKERKRQTNENANPEYTQETRIDCVAIIHSLLLQPVGRLAGCLRCGMDTVDGIITMCRSGMTNRFMVFLGEESHAEWTNTLTNTLTTQTHSRTDYDGCVAYFVLFAAELVII